MIDSGWVAALASLASALVVAIAALVAYRQLRHYRNANDIVVYLRLIDLMDAPAMLTARSTLAGVAERFASDADYRERLKDPAFNPPEFHDVGVLLRSLEHIAVLIAKGGIAEGLVLAEYADIFVAIWDQMRPAIVQRRLAFGPHTGRAFEHLAVRSRRYIQSGEMEREYAELEHDETALLR